MLGAVIGDVIGSIYEWDNYRAKDFPLFSKHCSTTDDSIMSIAVADALLKCNGNYEDLSNITIKSMQEIGRPYPHCGYGESFYHWIYSEKAKPYYSYGNGAAMRISPVSYVATSLEEVKSLSHKVTCISHDHPEGLKGALAVATAIFLALRGKTKVYIKTYINEHYYATDFTLSSLRENYRFNETCQNTVPQALFAFFESENFEDAIRTAISIGGDSDTIGAIVGGIAEAYYGIPNNIRVRCKDFIDKPLLTIIDKFEAKYPSKIELININN